MKDKLPLGTGGRRKRFVFFLRNSVVYHCTNLQSLGAGAWKTANLSWSGQDYLGFRDAKDQCCPSRRIWLARASLGNGGWGLIPPGASHVGRRAAPRKGHALAPQCTAGRVTQSGGYRRGRYGPAPPIPHSYPLGVARILPGRSPPCLPPATALGICRPTLGQESSPCRGGRSRVSLEARSSGGAGLLGLSPLQLFGSVGPRGRLLSLGWCSLGIGHWNGGPKGKDIGSGMPG